MLLVPKILQAPLSRCHLSHNHEVGSVESSPAGMSKDVDHHQRVVDEDLVSSFLFEFLEKEQKWKEQNEKQLKSLCQKSDHELVLNAFWAYCTNSIRIMYLIQSVT
jgi:hypothetical protein